MRPQQVLVRVACLLSLLCLPDLAHAQIRITLDNQFIETYQDRILIDVKKFLVEKAHDRPNPPKKDGDMHVAGHSTEIGLPTVAEIMNAKFESEAVDLVQEVKGTKTDIRVKGVWR